MLSRLNPRHSSYGWIVASTLAITETISYGALYYAFSVLIAPMEAEFGWSRTEITSALSIAILVSGFTGLGVGYWVDRYGARGLMTLASIAGTILLLAWASVNDLGTYYLIFFCLGMVMAGVFYDPAFVLIAQWFTVKRGHALALLTFVAGFASTIFLPLTNSLLTAYGWRGALIGLAIIVGGVTVPLHAIFLRKAPSQDQTKQSDTKPKNDDYDLRSALQSRTFWILTLAFAIAHLASLGIRVHFVTYLLERDYDPAVAATLAGIIGAMQVLGRVIYAPLQSRLSLGRIVAGLFVMQALSFLILQTGSSTVSIVLFVIVFGSSHGAMTLVRPAIVSDVFGVRAFGKINAVMAMVNTWSSTIAPVGVSLFYDRLGGYTPVIWILFGITLASIGTISLLRTDQ